MTDLDEMNDEPCMHGTQGQCIADNHLMPIDQAAALLKTTPAAVHVAVSRKQLISEGKDYQGRHVFDLNQLKAYDAKRRKPRIAPDA